MVTTYNVNKPIIHIGYPKTGTTWFQQEFFPHVEKIFFMCRDDVNKLIVEPSIFEFDAQKTKDLIISKAKGKRIVLCDELLLGGLDIGFGSGEFILLIANRLKVLFPNAIIIIFIRNQVDMIESAYSQYIKAGGTYSIKKYLGLNDRFNKSFLNHHLFNPKYFEFTNIIALYESLFEIVDVYLYEDFLINRSLFLNDFLTKHNFIIKDFNEKKVINKRLSYISISMYRLINHFYKSKTFFKNYYFNIPILHRLMSKFVKCFFYKTSTYELSKDLMEWVKKYYSNTNVQLIKWFPADKLNKYKYL